MSRGVCGGMGHSGEWFPVGKLYTCCLCHLSAKNAGTVMMQMQSRPDHNIPVATYAAGAGRSGDGLQMVSRAGLVYTWTVWLGGLGLDCEWLAGLVWERLDLDCIDFVYKTDEIMVNGGGCTL